MPNPIEIGDPSNILSSGLKVHGILSTNTIQPKSNNTVTINGERLYIGYSSVDLDTDHSFSLYAKNGVKSNGDFVVNGNRLYVGYETMPTDTTYSIYASHGIKIEGQSVGNSTTPIYIDSTGGFMPCSLSAYSQGEGINITNNVISNSGVRSISTGSANGTINVNTNGSSIDIAIKGLGSAAYTDSGVYLPSNANAYFDNGAQTATRGLRFKSASGGTYSHHMSLQGGSPSSTTGMAIYDVQNDCSALTYNDQSKILYLGDYSNYNTDIRLNGPITANGIINLKANQYYFSSNAYGLDAKNSDIIGLNALIFSDATSNYDEGIAFYRSSTAYDWLYAYSGHLYFTPNVSSTATSRTDHYVVCDQGTLVKTWTSADTTEVTISDWSARNFLVFLGSPYSTYSKASTTVPLASVAALSNGGSFRVQITDNDYYVSFTLTKSSATSMTVKYYGMSTETFPSGGISLYKF